MERADAITAPAYILIWDSPASLFKISASELCGAYVIWIYCGCRNAVIVCPPMWSKLSAQSFLATLYIYSIKSFGSKIKIKLSIISIEIWAEPKL